MKLLGFVSALTTLVATVSAIRSISEETKTIDQLHAEAVKEGCGMVVYHGGDTASGQHSLRAAWKAAFPDTNLTVLVDYKFHDVRADNQLARNDLEVDIIALQTLQDYPRWVKNGDLLQYKPAGFSKIYDKFKDPKGFWTSHRHVTFGFSYNEAQLGGLAPPKKSPADLVDPKWTGKIASAYPNDDDATLFVYMQYAKRYGWEWVERMAKQQLQFGRGANTPGEAQSAKRKVIAVGSGISLSPSNSTIKPVYGNGVSFVLWGQRIDLQEGQAPSRREAVHELDPE